jgi:hypothetical protein
MDVCLLWVLSGRGVSDELITHPEESYWLVRHCLWSRNLVNEEALAHCRGCCSQKKCGIDVHFLHILWFSSVIYNFTTASYACGVGTTGPLANAVPRWCIGSHPNNSSSSNVEDDNVTMTTTGVTLPPPHCHYHHHCQHHYHYCSSCVQTKMLYAFLISLI